MASEPYGADVPVGGSPTPYPPGGPGHKTGSVRTIRLRFLPTLDQEEVLEGLADACVKLWNENTYEPRQLYFQGRLGREAVEEIWRK